MRKNIIYAVVPVVILLAGCSLPWTNREAKEDSASSKIAQEQTQVPAEETVIISGEGQIYDDASLFTEAEGCEESVSPDGLPVLESGCELSDCIDLCDLETLTVTVEYEPEPTREDAVVQAKLSMDAKPAGDYYEIERGDVVDVDLYAYIDGDEVPELSRTGAQIYVGAGGTEKAIEDALIGMIVGSSRKAEVTYADDIEYMDLGGKTVTYNIVVSSVATAGVPEEAAVDNAYEELVRYTHLANHEKLMETLKTAVVDGSTVKAYPEKIVRQARARYEMFCTAGYGSVEDYLNETGMTRAEFKKSEDAYASIRAKEELVLEALKERTGLTEAGDEYKNYIAQYGISNDDVDETMMKVILSELAEDGLIRIEETGHQKTPESR